MSAAPAPTLALPPDRGDSVERLLTRWTDFLARRRVALLVILVLLGGIFAWLSRGIRWQADLLAFFSADSGDVRDLRAAAGKTGIATQLRIDVHAAPGSAADDDAIKHAARDLASRLRTQREFRNVWDGISTADITAAYARLLGLAPALLTDDDLAHVKENASPAAIARHFDDVAAHLADPDGEVQLRRLAANPLGMGDLIGNKLLVLSPGSKNEPASPTTTSMDDGLLTARDSAGNLHVMLVLDPATPPSDQQAAAQVMAAVTAAIAQIQSQHPGIDTWIIGAHRAYVENAQHIKRDVGIVSTLGTFAVALAIFLFFRRRARTRASFGTVLICLIPPSVGIGIALGIAGIFHAELPLILLGFSGLLCGSTTDYGIQILSECRRLASVPQRAPFPARAARRMFGPISMSVATSVTGFAALGLSAAPGLRQLGLFVAGATLCIWIVTFLLLPAFITPGMCVVQMANLAAPARRLFRARGWRIAGAAAFAAVTAFLFWRGTHAHFDTNPRSLDGSSQNLIAQEASFYNVWGDLRHRAIVQVHAATPSAALTMLGQVTDYLRDQQRDGLIQNDLSPAAILPDDATAKERAATWTAYWTTDRIAALRTALADAAKSHGMKPESFTTYADRITISPLAAPAERIAQSPATLFPGFIETTAAGVTISSIVDMRADRSLRMATGWAPELRVRFADDAPGTLSILSGDLLIFDATERARAEAERLAPYCLLAILVPLLIYFRSLRRAWLVMLCLLAGFIWVLGIAQLFGRGLNLLSLVPMLFTLGVAVDYGIYRASERTGPANPGSDRSAATFLCALTTILGSGALLFASHPALHWLGLTLVAGITGGYLASLLIVAPLAHRRAEKTPAGRGKRIAAMLARNALRLALAALTLLLCIPLYTEWGMSRMSAPLAEYKTANREPPLEHPAPRTYVTGDSWLRWHAADADTGIWELFLSGDEIARGYAATRLAAPIDIRIENEMLEQLDTFLPDIWSRWLVVHGIEADMLSLPTYVSYQDQYEIYNAARVHHDPHDYLAPTYPRILSYHALHDISQMLIDNPLVQTSTFACTGVVSLPSYTSAQPGGHLMLARIFDFEGGESFGRQKSLTFVVPPKEDGIPFAHVAWPGLSGAVTGMNQEKIAVFLNAAATSDVRRIGTPTILMARDILQHAHTIAEAQAIIRDTQVFVSDIIVIADGKTGTARVFEKSPARMASYDVDLSAVITNHLITPTFASDPVNQQRVADGTTMQRYGRARELLDAMQNHVTPEGLAGLLRDKKGPAGKPLGFGNRNTIDALIACHAVIMDVTSGEMWIAAWPNAEGKFLGTNIMELLSRDTGNPGVHAPATVPEIAPDSMMLSRSADVPSEWQCVQLSRAAAEKAADALQHQLPEKALSLVADVIRLNPDFYAGYELRGRAELMAGNTSAAGEDFKKALSLDPPYAARRKTLEGLLRQCQQK